MVFDEPRDVEELGGTAMDRIGTNVYGKKLIEEVVRKTMLESDMMQDHSVKDVKALAEAVSEAALEEALRIVFRCRKVEGEIVEFARQRVNNEAAWVKLG